MRDRKTEDHQVPVKSKRESVNRKGSRAQRRGQDWSSRSTGTKEEVWRGQDCNAERDGI